MSANDWTEVIGAAGVFTLVITVVTVTIVQVAHTWRARATLAREQQYRALAEAATAAQQEVQHQLAEVTRRLGELTDQLTRVQRVLTQVE